MHADFKSEGLKGRDYLRYPGMDGFNISKILKGKWFENFDWT
jgi:hypothetical protein